MIVFCKTGHERRRMDSFPINMTYVCSCGHWITKFSAHNAVPAAYRENETLLSLVDASIDVVVDGQSIDVEYPRLRYR